MDENHSSESVYWLAIPQHDGWGLVTDISGRKVGLIFSTDMKGHTLLKIAGYHMGEAKWIGEHQNILTVKIERIPENLRSKILPQIRKSLVRELQDVQMVFLDDSYMR